MLIVTPTSHRHPQAWTRPAHKCKQTQEPLFPESLMTTKPVSHKGSEVKCRQVQKRTTSFIFSSETRSPQTQHRESVQTWQVMAAASRMRSTSEGDLIQRIWWVYFWMGSTFCCRNASWTAGWLQSICLCDAMSSRTAFALWIMSGRSCTQWNHSNHEDRVFLHTKHLSLPKQDPKRTEEDEVEAYSAALWIPLVSLRNLSSSSSQKHHHHHGAAWKADLRQNLRFKETGKVLNTLWSSSRPREFVSYWTSGPLRRHILLQRDLPAARPKALSAPQTISFHGSGLTGTKANARITSTATS